MVDFFAVEQPNKGSHGRSSGDIRANILIVKPGYIITGTDFMIQVLEGKSLLIRLDWMAG